MPRLKKSKFVPKKKKTLIPEPNWESLSKAKTQDAQLKAWAVCDDYVHFEVTDKETLHAIKRWIELQSGWDLADEVKIIPDTYLLTFAKNGWKARRLGFMPDSVYASLEKNLKPLVERAEELKITPDNPHAGLDTNYFLHPSKVKTWVKKWSDYLKSIKSWQDSSDAKLRIQYQTAETYVYNMNVYLRTGIWSDTHWGENREFKIMTVCKALAFDHEGNTKRTVGVWYPDIGNLWTKEMECN